MLVPEMLVDMRRVDLRHAAVLEHGEVRAAADHVDAGLVLHVDDGPAGLGLPAAQVEAEVLLGQEHLLIRLLLQEFKQEMVN